MDQWRQSLMAIKQKAPEKAGAVDAMLEGTSVSHQWYQMNHHRPTFCNHCREKLSGITWHGWSCETCKMKAHKKCISNIVEKCKWTIECTVPSHLQYISPENSIVAHQWVEGNLAMSSRCVVCEKVCGSVLKLADWRCLWCACCVHSSCLPQLGRGCSLGATSLSVIPPLAVRDVSQEGVAQIRTDAIGGECGGGSPLLVLVNSKSGDNQGQRMIRKFKRLLNPLQVFDIIATGPDFALSFFDALDSFRVLVCGGDGTVGWVLGAFDRLGLHNKCQLAILPLGTGNDLARVLGWGHAFYDDTQLPQLLRTFERAHTRMLDRWSVLSIEGPQAIAVWQYEETITKKLCAVMDADDPGDVFRAVKSLCETVRGLMEQIATTFTKVEQWEREAGRPPSDPITEKCSTLLQKLDVLMNSLISEEEKMEESGFEPEDDERTASEERQRRDSLVGRANSLKKALKDIMNIAERGIDQHTRASGAATKRDRFRKKRSKTIPSVLKVSSSNLSSSSACTPPGSPSPQQTRPQLCDFLTVRDASSQQSQTSGIEFSPSQSSNPGFPTFEVGEIAQESSSSFPNGCSDRAENDVKDDLEPKFKFSIARVVPPTPIETREPSAVGETDRPCVSGSGDERRDRLFKPHSDCELYHGETGADIKLSHSDSSIYDRTTEGSSGSRVHDGSYNRARLKEGKKVDTLPSIKRGILTTSLAGGSLIAEVLLLNARVLGLGDLSSSECHTPLEQYRELKVMNNYFGIGLDAKIALEFHNKREESDKTRSRSRLFMWYGILGGKELMHRTYRNLDQRIRLECDGVRIDLPSLQGIVILNIPSYSGGANFWGSSKDDTFSAQSFDDRLLEVVALFGVIHVATSRVPNVVRLQNHRIAQCRHIRIVIMGTDPIPVQVDGEPWLQPPGIMQIVHKNRAQLLVRNPAFDAALKKWEEQKERSTAPSTPTSVSTSLMAAPGEDLPFVRRAAEFVQLVESEIAQLGVSSGFLEALEAAAVSVRAAEEEPVYNGVEGQALREEALAAIELVVDRLEDHFGWTEHTRVPAGQPRLGPAPLFTFEVHGDEPEHWRYVLCSIRQEISREEAALKELRTVETGHRKRSRLTDWITRKWKRRTGAPSTHVTTWSVDDVSLWLSSLGLSHYASQFKANDIRGHELIHLERTDMKDLGVLKIGHAKRLQSAIAELREKEVELRRESRRSGRKGTSLSVERAPVESAPELPSLSSI
ncbi:Diacylglycerol kinase [Trichostrongylus colubriformis]|uniref:Diacylglycerol kinase n=1 Tax=Trichostrongylus colubriformis TaxID=6319 RepID=A0AAN8FR59_TRICO